jgi:hypothetical protein
VRQSLFITAAATALASGLSVAQAMPLTPLAGAAPAPVLERVQYWGGWGPRYYYGAEPRFYEPPVYAPQPRYAEPEERIAAHEAATIMRSMGYRPTSAASFGNGAWAIEGLDREGARVRVIIDAYSGRPIRVRYVAPPNGQRFGTPPVWPDERPSFYPRDGRRPVPQRETELDPEWDRPGPVERPVRPARPERDRTARAMPVPTPRPYIEAPAEPQPRVVPPSDMPPAAAAPIPQPPAASLAPDAPTVPAVRAIPTPRMVTPQPATPPLSVVPEPPVAALPARPDPEPPTLVVPPVVPEPAAPQAAPLEPQPAPSAALPAVPAPLETQPASPQVPALTPERPVVAAPVTPEATVPQPEPQAAARPDEGVMVDGRFLGPNGETLPGAPADRPAVRRITP